MQARTWAQTEWLTQYSTQKGGREDRPGHSPTTLPSSLPSLYHDRHFALNTDYPSVSTERRLSSLVLCTKYLREVALKKSKSKALESAIIPP